MGFFNWFKSTKKQEVISKEDIIEIVKEVLKQETTKSPSEQTIPLIRSTILSNNTLTVILSSGRMLNCFKASKELLDKVNAATSEEEIQSLMAPELTKEDEQVKGIVETHKKELKAINDSFEVFRQSKDFEVKENAVYFKGIDRTLPKLLVTRLGSLIGKEDEQEYISLKRFWFWCCLNPNAEVADLLYGFLENNCLRLNKQGFFYALRNVVSIKGVDTTLVTFISNTYTHIKAVWKKLPLNYEVFQNTANDKDFMFKHKDKGISKEKADRTWKLVGNLKDLYDTIGDQEGNRYTDNYSGTFDIRVGKVVSMPYEDCNWSTADCATAGLHFTLDQINYVGCGDTSMLILINPAKVVGIGTEKGRCYEYLPVMTVPRDEVTQLLHDKDFDTLQLDEWYATQEVEDLEKKTKESFAIEASKHTFTPNTKVDVDLLITNIVKGLEDIKTELTQRVINV